MESIIAWSFSGDRSLMSGLGFQYQSDGATIRSIFIIIDERFDNPTLVNENKKAPIFLRGFYYLI
jgi:hypothetical protein